MANNNNLPFIQIQTEHNNNRPDYVKYLTKEVNVMTKEAKEKHVKNKIRQFLLRL